MGDCTSHKAKSVMCDWSHMLIPVRRNDCCLLQSLEHSLTPFPVHFMDAVGAAHHHRRHLRSGAPHAHVAAVKVT